MGVEQGWGAASSAHRPMSRQGRPGRSLSMRRMVAILGSVMVLVPSGVAAQLHQRLLVGGKALLFGGSPATVARFFLSPVTELRVVQCREGAWCFWAAADADVRLVSLDGRAFPRTIVDGETAEFFVGAEGARGAVVSWRPKGMDPGLQLEPTTCGLQILVSERPTRRRDGRVEMTVAPGEEPPTLRVVGELRR